MSQPTCVRLLMLSGRSAMSDVGLEQMEQQRQRVRRQPPPPRHPKPASPASAGDGGVNPETHQAEQRPLHVAQAEVDQQTRGTARSTVREWVPVPPTGELKPTPIRFDARTHQYLREQGADSKLRGLNVSASAVVRLAMSRLIRELDPQQVNDLLVEAVSERPGPGRKRR